MADALLNLTLCLPAPLFRPLSVFGTAAINSAPTKPHCKPPSKETVIGFCGHSTPARLERLKVFATTSVKDGPKWWEKSVSENMIDVHSTEEFLSVLSQAGEKLVVVKFYGTWCASCRALFSKLCRTAQENPDVLFVKVNFDENKPMCRRLSVKVLPYFHFYRGADGLLESFSCSLVKFQKLKDAIAVHNTARCIIGPPAGVGDLDLYGD